MAGSLGAHCIAAAMSLGVDGGEHHWPSTRYRDDPVGFFIDILGARPWSKQQEVIESVHNHDRVAVCSGHKVSKSHTAAGLALWFYSSYEDARVVMTSTTARQVDQILWRELRMMHARSGVCADCRLKGVIVRPCPHSHILDGEPMVLARSGLKADFREIVGFTARESEAVAGVSGANLFYIVDEASGVPDDIYEAIEGNRAGGAKILLLGNPTKTTGEHFHAFNSKQAFYRTHRISSEDTPNCIEGRKVIPGLATREWVEEKRKEWGEDSPMYKVRVKGEHALSEDGKINSIDLIGEAEGRWEDDPGEGRLHIGVDPAGPGEGGDESAIAVRRGTKVLAVYTWRGLNDDQHIAHIRYTIQRHSLKREQPPIVCLDCDGPIGAGLFGALRAHNELHPTEFDLVGIRSSDKPVRQPNLYDRMRDELWAYGSNWLRGFAGDGSDAGALPESSKLAQELHEPEWVPHGAGKLKVTPKKILRKALGRSTDRADAVLLAIWEPAAARPPNRSQAPREHIDPHPGKATSVRANPYSFDPFGGRGGGRG